jgi:hypothetical protein
MARSVQEIQQAIINDVQATPELAGATSSSKRAIWRLWTFVVAVAINILEQLQDLFKSEVETKIALSAPATPQWLQDKAFKFQYDAANPQILQLINLVPQYPIVNPDLRIITRCSVRTTVSNQVQIKVAKSEPPQKLSTAELNALETYITTLGVAGVQYAVLSEDSDKLFIDADITYDGQFSSVISDRVIAAIENYLASIPFDGQVKISDLLVTIREVTGVNDVVLNNVKARKDNDPLSAATSLVSSNTLLNPIWNTVSGYIVGETTSGSELSDTLTFIAQ